MEIESTVGKNNFRIKMKNIHIFYILRTKILRKKNKADNFFQIMDVPTSKISYCKCNVKEAKKQIWNRQEAIDIKIQV